MRRTCGAVCGNNGVDIPRQPQLLLMKLKDFTNKPSRPTKWSASLVACYLATFNQTVDVADGSLVYANSKSLC